MTLRCGVGSGANILSTNFVQLGLSYVRGSDGLLYWTMTLARGLR